MGKNKITARDVYNELWRCRDFELTNLWQRSVFLSAFLILCFTGYGVVVMKIGDCYEEHLCKLHYYHRLAFLLSVVGFVFSYLWIMMGKASKAWYEQYDRAIVAFCEIKRYQNSKARR